MSLICRICGERGGHPTWTAKEQMFGMGGEFLYFQCHRCFCLQIADIPEDLFRFYPSEYYSFNAKAIPFKGWKAKAAGFRDRAAALGNWDSISSLFCKLTSPRMEVVSLASAEPTLQSRILDVGCGSGQLLSILHRAGFPNLTGIDPFLDSDREITPGVVVRKQKLEDVEGVFDIIMLHHVFEHLPDGEKALDRCKRLLARGGKILLRFPTPDSYAWKYYEENWVQLDAPRHLFLYSRRSIEILADRLKLRVAHWSCDSNTLQFWGSELYRRGKILNGACPEKHFSSADIGRFESEASRLNREGKGDQVVVLLTLL